MPSPTLIVEQSRTKFAFILKIGAILRVTSLSILFAGCSAIVFAAITLVKAAEAKGVAASVAATTNAPVFLNFSKIIAIAGVALLIAEAADSFFSRRYTRFKLVQYIATAVCCLCAFNFAFVVSPEMEHLLPYIHNSVGIHEAFQNLHESSRLLFGGIILFAWISLIMPVFQNHENSESSKVSSPIKTSDKSKK